MSEHDDAAVATISDEDLMLRMRARAQAIYAAMVASDDGTDATIEVEATITHAIGASGGSVWYMAKLKTNHADERGVWGEWECPRGSGAKSMREALEALDYSITEWAKQHAECLRRTAEFVDEAAST